MLQACHDKEKGADDEEDPASDLVLDFSRDFIILFFRHGEDILLDEGNRVMFHNQIS